MAEKNRVVESMTRIPFGAWMIRVWRDENPFTVSDFGYPNADIEDNLRTGNPQTVGEIARLLDRCPRVAAYEILDQNGNGVVVYPDWS